MKKQKILFITDRYPSPYHPYIRDLVELLKTRFTGLRLFLYHKNENAYYRIPVTGLKNKPFLLLYALSKLIIHFSHASAVYKELRDKNYPKSEALFHLINNCQLLGKKWGLVHINAIQLEKLFPSRKLFGGAPKLLISVRGEDFDFYPTRFDNAIKRADHCHVISKYLLDQCLIRDTNKNKYTLIYPAVKSVEKNNLPAYQQTLHICTMARLVPHKGIHLVMRALRQIKDNVKFHYHILGDGPEKEHLIYEANRLGIEEHITIHGFQTHNESKKIMQACHLFTLFSYSEGFSNAVLMAQSMGIPCIVSDAGGLPENVTHETSGLVIPKYDVDKLAEAFLQMTKEPEKMKTLSDNATMRITDEFLLINQAKQFEELYVNLMNG